MATWLVNRIEWLALLFGLARIGASLVAVNTRFRAAELEYVLRRAMPKMRLLQHNFRMIARSVGRVTLLDPAIEALFPAHAAWRSF